MPKSSNSVASKKRRKKILKKHFGTVEKLKLASLDELKEVKSIPESILTKIYEYFHSV